MMVSELQICETKTGKVICVDVAVLPELDNISLSDTEQRTIMKAFIL